MTTGTVDMITAESAAAVREHAAAFRGLAQQITAVQSLNPTSIFSSMRVELARLAAQVGIVKLALAGMGVGAVAASTYFAVRAFQAAEKQAKSLATQLVMLGLDADGATRTVARLRDAGRTLGQRFSGLGTDAQEMALIMGTDWLAQMEENAAFIARNSDQFKDAGDVIEAWFEIYGQALKDGATEAAAAAKANEWFTETNDAITAQMGPFSRSLEAARTQLVMFRDTIEPAWRQVQTMVSWLAAAAVWFVALLALSYNLGASLKGGIGDALGAVGEIWQKFWGETFPDFFTTAAAWFIGKLTDLNQGWLELVLSGNLSIRDAWARWWKFESNKWIMRWNDLVRIVKSAVPQFVQAGVDVILGFRDGFVSKMREIEDMIRSWVQRMIALIRSVWREGSPSKVMMEIGKNVADGFRIGVERNMPTELGLATAGPGGNNFGGNRNGGSHHTTINIPIEVGGRTIGNTIIELLDGRVVRHVPNVRL